MHELSVTEQLVEIVLEHARKAKAERVLKINLVIGELSSFVGESIQFYFDVLSKGTEAESASLSISRIPAKARCRECNIEFHPGGTDWFCPTCSGPIEQILEGREFYVESIEVE
ncbi:MAG TPA: hydrogenase maturation nickel metallochaperone HypA [Thermodesulfobacteriota bacterium]|nr:hydrogenase maturation nickel metallochaperone HypA [Thermodesulfobacteriota bacterium]